MRYCYDIDGTLCSNTEGAYETAQPFVDVIADLNKLYEAGHEIHLYTARGTTTGINWGGLTRAQLSQWGVQYHSLSFGKPTADVYIDDKAVNIAHWRSERGL